MRSSRGFSFLSISTAVMALSLSATFAQESSELNDRVVDQAAVEMQSEADGDLAALVSRYRGTVREAEMLLRLAELRMEIAEGLFRVAYGPSEGGLKKAHIAKTKSALAPLSRILSKYPKSPGAPRALFLRAKAYKEIGQSKSALKDFEAFVARHGNRVEAGISAIAIADLSIESRNFKRTISVLAGLAKQPNHPLYAHALAKRAWAYNVEEKFTAAIRTLSALAKYFATRQAAGSLSASDQGLRTAVLGDVAAIGYSSFRETRGKFSLVKVNELLRSFDTGEGYRAMALNMSDRLRTADLGAELRAWKGIVLKSEPARRENLPMLIGMYEYDLGREAYSEVVKTAVDLSAIVAQAMDADEAEDARKLVVKTADILIKRITDYRASPKANEAEKQLAILLPAFDRMTVAQDARKSALRWNLAETYFSLDRFASATRAYRGIVEAGKGSGGANLVQQASLKAISSRYEDLRVEKVVPQDLKAQAKIVSLTKASTQEVAELREWMIWIDSYEREYSTQLEQFQFEAARALYAAGFQDEAMGRLKKLALRQTNSKVSVAAASLVVDTWIARDRYDQVEAEARDFASAKGWAQADFAAKMGTQAAAAKFKRAERAYAAKNYKEAAEQAAEFRNSYRASNLALDATGIVCNSEMAMGQASNAVDCFLGLAKDFPKTKAAEQALRSAARIEDERLNFKPAMAAYSRYLETTRVSASESLAIRKRILQLARATGEVETMEKAAQAKTLCRPKLEAECDLNQALAALIESQSKPGRSALEKAYRNMSRARPAHRSIWAMVVAGNSQAYDARGVDQALKALAANWKYTDPSVRFFLVARATETIPAILEQERTGLKKAGLAVSEASITRRMNGLAQLESRAKVVATVPVNAVQAAASQSVYLGFSDLIADMRALPAGKDATPAQKREHQKLVASLVHPLVLKARKIRDAGMALARKDERGLSAKNCSVLFKPAALASNSKTPAVERLAQEWQSAIQGENWTRVAFFSDEVVEMKGVSSAWSKAARAASLANAGASAEAGVVFTDACRESSATSGLRAACRQAKDRG